MEPEEIREIRERLGLTQVAAGELLGGGPRAFAKYESDTIKPSAALVKLLRLLDENPAALPTLRGNTERSEPIATHPFEITGEHIRALSKSALTTFVRQLLNAEALENNLPSHGIHVASNQSVADGGEDGRIQWNGEPEGTNYLTSRFTQFQIKSGPISPSNAANDVLTKNGEVKDMVRSALETGAHYVLLCSRPYTQKQIKAREDKVRESLSKAGIIVDHDQIRFRDADWLASWVNSHPPLAMQLKEQIQPGTVGPFRSWVHWMNRAEHAESPFVEDDRLPSLQERIQASVTVARSALRVVGPSCIGKSRLVLEAVGSVTERKLPLVDTVVYADQSEADAARINDVIRTLADLGTRAIVVIDRCPPESHETLERMISRDGSNLSLVTIDIVEHQTQAREMKSTIVLDHAPLTVTEAIIDRTLPNLPSEDRRRLILFSEGFPGIATALARSWAESRPVGHSIEDHFADSFVKGRNDPEPEVALKSAMLLAAFGHIDLDERASDQLDEIASRGRNLSARDLRAAIVRMVDRGVAQQQGRLVVLQPRPVAMKLTERQWNEWSPQEWCELLVGNGSPSLKRQIARQLAWLNTTSVSNRVLEEICHRKGHFNTLGAFSQPGQEEVLRALAAIDAQAVAEQIECALESVADLSEIGGSLRRLLVGTLERIAFSAETFDTGARLLLRLAAAENELAISNNATGQFTALFPVVGASTAADGNTRLALLDEEVDSADVSRRTVAVKGLIAGLNTGTIFRFVGAETHGSRPALRSWRPANPKAAQDYVVSCVLRVAAIAEADDEIGLVARTELGHELRQLISVGLIDTLETVIPKIAVTHNDWTSAIESLGNVLEFDVGDEDAETAKRIQALLDLLAPKTDAARVRFLVTAMPWDYPNGEKLDFAERENRQIQAVKDLALELGEKPSVLAEVLPQICVGTQRWANLFGQSIAKTVPSAQEWLNRIVSASLSVTKPERNSEFLVGYIVGLADDHPDIVEAFKGFAARSPDLAPTLPSVCALLGVTSTDVDLAIEALRDGVLHPEFLNQWALGRALEDVPASTVATLIDSMLDHSEVAFSVSPTTFEYVFA